MDFSKCPLVDIGKVAYDVKRYIDFGAQHGGRQINLLNVYQYSGTEPNLVKGGMVLSHSLQNSCQLTGGESNMLGSTYYLVVGAT